MAYRTIRGSILYTSKKPERMDQERGREHFVLIQQAGGTIFLLTHYELTELSL